MDYYGARTSSAAGLCFSEEAQRGVLPAALAGPDAAGGSPPMHAGSRIHAADPLHSGPIRHGFLTPRRQRRARPHNAGRTGRLDTPRLNGFRSGREDALRAPREQRPKRARGAEEDHKEKQQDHCTQCRPGFGTRG